MDIPPSVGVDDALPWGVHHLSTPPADAATRIGEEAGDLLALADAGLPLARGLIVALSGEAPDTRLSTAVARALAAVPSGGEVRGSLLLPARVLGARLARREGLAFAVSTAGAIPRAVDSFFAAARTAEVLATLGGSLAQIHARVVRVDPAASGRAASADPVNGDPDHLRVFESSLAPWSIDRRSARVLARGEGALDANAASTVADLADRAQLVLGRPVEIGWCTSEGRLAITGVRPLSVAPAFTPVPFRIVTLIASDEGTVAPLSVDCLDRALRRADDDSDEAVVRRIFARPYRRMDDTVHTMRRRSDPARVARAAAHAASVMVDVAAPVAAARRLSRGLRGRLDELSARDARAPSDDQVASALRARQQIVVEAMTLLDHLRIATLGALTALESTVGALPAECFPALSWPAPTRARRRAHERMARLAGRIEDEAGTLVPAAELPARLARPWADLRSSVADLRPLGLDVRATAYGADDEALLAALRARPWDRDDNLARARREAIRRLGITARGRPVGRTREALAGTVGLMLERIVRAKGSVAEGLASASLALRQSALAAGERLAERGLVEEPEDALYMYVAEVGQGLAGEPGAYAARVRLRREDDQRWIHLPAPRRIERRLRG